MSRQTNGRAADTRAKSFTAKQAEQAKRRYASYRQYEKSKADELAKKYGCEPWEIVADTLTFCNGGKLRIMCVADMNNPIKECWKRRIEQGVRFIQAPNGKRYYGTPQEVRDAALYPHYRDSIASSMRITHSIYVDGTITRFQLEEACKEKRRETIYHSEVAATDDLLRELDENTHLLVNVAVRETGTTYAEYIRKAVNEALKRTQAEIGGEFHFTRHERAALLAHGGKLKLGADHETKGVAD